MADSDMDDVTREELQNRLIREISSVLDGNHVRSSDIRIRSCEGAFAHCNASVIWHFGHSVRTESHVGRKEAPRHFGGDRAALEAALTELCEHADQDVELLSREAYALLKRRLDGFTGAPEEHLLKPELVEKDSVAPRD